MKGLYVDDKRTPKDLDGEWTIVRSAKEAYLLLEAFQYDVVSLDHDLGEGETGYDILCEIEEDANRTDYPPPQVLVHTANEGARIKMVLGANRINKIRQERIDKEMK